VLTREPGAMTGTGHVSIASNMSAMAIASCSLPSTSSSIAARIHATSAPAQNDGPGTCQDDGPKLRRALAGEARERRSQLGDDRCVEGVVDVGPVERHACHDATRAVALDSHVVRHASVVRRCARRCRGS
jgi:hypothetical protein